MTLWPSAQSYSQISFSGNNCTAAGSSCRHYNNKRAVPYARAWHTETWKQEIHDVTLTRLSSRTHLFSLSLSLFLSLSHTHFHALTLTHTHTQTTCSSLGTLSLSYTYLIKTRYSQLGRRPDDIINISKSRGMGEWGEGEKERCGN